ncbi:MAG: N-acetylmuramoyl-L-alanine amidase family protein [Candidatus Xenobia bacterium]
MSRLLVLLVLFYPLAAHAQGLTYTSHQLTIVVNKTPLLFHPIPVVVRVAKEVYVSPSDPALVQLLKLVHATLEVAKDQSTVTITVGTDSSTWNVNDDNGTLRGRAVMHPGGMLVRNGDVIIAASLLSDMLGLTLSPLPEPGSFVLVSTINTVHTQADKIFVSGSGDISFTTEPFDATHTMLIFPSTSWGLPQDRLVQNGVTLTVMNHGDANNPTRLMVEIPAGVNGHIASQQGVNGCVIAVSRIVPPTVTATSGVVVLDPGHGGSDPGAISPFSGLREKDVTLAICLKLRQELESRGVKVIMTRDDDRDLTYAGSPDAQELQARADVANSNQADLFISVHCNANTSSEMRGTSLHWYKDIDQPLATALEDALSLGIPMNGLVHSSFHVLRNTTAPSVLVETAFITNEEEGGLLGTEAFRDRIATELATGIASYLQHAAALKQR